MMTQKSYEEINASMLLEFNRILEEGDVTTVFQPIVDLKIGGVLGYEALSRGPENTLLHSPAVLLSIAELLNKTWELERLLRIKALENAHFTDTKKLFLNVDPNVIKDEKFIKGFTKDNLKKMQIKPDSIVLEITERTAIHAYEDFKHILKHYKEQGYAIAIDDAGSGYSGLKTLYETHPEYLKIDMDFIRNIHKDTFKQAIVKSLVEIAAIANIKTIGEGIETADELKTLIRLGVNYGQGYFLKRPEKNTSDLPKELIELIHKENLLQSQINSYSDDYHYIYHLMDEVQAFHVDEKCKDVFEYLNDNDLTSICVADKGWPLGIVTLTEINRVFAKQFGYSVHSHRPVEIIMDKNPLIVDFYTPIHLVAKEALQRSQEHLYDDIIVSKASKYAGIVTMKQVLYYAITYEKNHAKELNPLTSLPGNVIINRVLQSLLESENDSTILYIDLDNFKAYNDVYGFEAGDQVIKMTADLIHEVAFQHAPYTSFIGHIGGDDFIMINNANEDITLDICTHLIKDFDYKMATFFREEDLIRGRIQTQDRYGETKQFPLTAISLACIMGRLYRYESVEKISASLMAVKKEAKINPSSSFVLKQV